MKLISYSLFLSVLFWCACSNHNNHRTNNKLDKGEDIKIIMPENIVVYNPFITDVRARFKSDRRKEFTIYPLIDVSCATCLLKLGKWDQIQFQDSLFNKEVAIIPICYSRDHFEQLKFIFENQKISKIKIPLILDDSFRTRNRALAKRGDFTALTDRENHILFTGFPLKDKADKEKLFQLIRDDE